jgi:hypothetical protein
MDLWWGVLVWLAMTTGARRGELCALRWDDLDLDRAVLNVRSAIAREGSQTWEKDTKTHQQRRIALDQTTVGLLRAYRGQCDEFADALDVEIAASGRMFSSAPDHMAHTVLGQPALRPDVRPPRLGHEHPRTAPLLRHRADLRRGRCPHGRGPTRPRRGRHDNPAHLCRVGSGSRPTRGGTFDEHVPALPVDLDEVGRTSKRPGRGRRAGRETRTSASRPTCVPRSPAGRCDREIIRRPWKPWPHAMAWRRALRIEPSPNSTRMDW